MTVGLGRASGFSWLAVAAILVSLTLAAPAAAEDDFAIIQKNAAAVLTGVCAQCHGASPALRTNSEHQDKPASDLALGDADALVNMSDFNPVVVPGQPGKSEIIRQTKRKRDGKNGMPQGTLPGLTDEQFDALISWVSCLPDDYDGVHAPIACRDGGLDQARAYLASLDSEGQPSIVETKPGTTPVTPAAAVSISITTVVKTITTDLFSLTDQRRADARYVLLTNLRNEGASSEDLDIYRAGLARGLNSLSTNSSIAKLVALDPDQTIYRFFLSDLGWSTDQWTKLMAEYPYSGVPTVDPLESDPNAIVLATTQFLSAIPNYTTTGQRFSPEAQIFARGDWLVRVATHPGRYEKLLRLPNSLQELEAEILRVSPEDDIRRQVEGVVRGGFPPDGEPKDSGVSSFSRIIERHTLPTVKDGYYWKSFDFGSGNSGFDAVPKNPLEPSELSSEARAKGLGFVHDGGEMIFSLHNGLQGYFITTVKGTPLPSAPNDIVNLKNDNFEKNALPVRYWEYLFLKRFKNTETGDVIKPTNEDIFNGLSCMACHFNGMKENVDSVGPYFANMGAAISRDYTQDDLELIKYLYDGANLERWQDQDARTFADAVIEAYRAIGLSEQSPGWKYLVLVGDHNSLGGFDPVTRLATAYVDPLTSPDPAANLKKLAAELWLDVPSLNRAALSNRLTVAGFVGRLNGGTDPVRRETGNFVEANELGEGPFECQFAAIAQDLRWVGIRASLTNDLSDRADICRKLDDPNYVAPTQQGEITPVVPPLKPVDTPASDVTITSDKLAYNVGEKVVLTAKNSIACYLTIIDIDSQGVLTVLFPNKFRPDNYVAADSTTVVPTEADGFDLRITSESVDHDTVIAVCDPEQRDIEGIKHDFANYPITQVRAKTTLGIEVAPKSPRNTIIIGVLK